LDFYFSKKIKPLLQLPIIFCIYAIVSIISPFAILKLLQLRGQAQLVNHQKSPLFLNGLSILVAMGLIYPI
jgi:hypothetical protein